MRHRNSNRLASIEEKDRETARKRQEEKKISKELIAATERNQDLIQRKMNIDVQMEATNNMLKQTRDACQEMKSLRRNVTNEYGDVAHLVSEKHQSVQSNVYALSLLKARCRQLQERIVNENADRKQTYERSHEKNSQFRALEREMFNLKNDNSETLSHIAHLRSRLSKIELEEAHAEDVIAKEARHAELKTIALEQKVSDIMLEVQPLQWQFADTMKAIEKEREEMRVRTECCEKEKAVLLERIQREEESNDKITKEISAKSHVDSNIMLDIAELHKEKREIVKLLNEKNEICLEEQRKLFEWTERLREATAALRETDEKTRDMYALVENMRAEFKISAYGIEETQRSSGQLHMWTRKEMSSKHTLQDELDNIVSRETVGYITEKKDESKRESMKHQLRAKNERIKELTVAYHHVLASMDILVATKAVKDKELQEAKGKFQKIATSVQKVEKEINRRECNFRRRREAHELRKSELRVDKIGECDDEIFDLEARQKEKDFEIKAIQDALEKRVTDSDRTVHKLSEQIFELDEEKDDKESTLRGVMSRNRILKNSILSASQRTKLAHDRECDGQKLAFKIADLNSKEFADLQNRVKCENEKILFLKADMKKLIARRDALTVKFHTFDAERMRHSADIRKLKDEEDAAVERLEGVKEEELYREKALESVEAAWERLRADVEEREECVRELRLGIVNAKGRAENLKKEIDQAESRENDLINSQETAPKQIHKLRVKLAEQEDRHKRDALVVKDKISELTSALEDKKKIVTSLEKSLAGLLQHNASSQMRVEQTATESAHRENVIARRIDDKRMEIADLRAESEALRRRITYLQSADLEMEEKHRIAGTRVHKSEVENKATMLEKYRKDEEAHFSEIQQHDHTIKLREYVRTLEGLIETAQELNMQENEARNTAAELRHEITNLLGENKVMKRLIDDKIHEEQVVAVQLEAERRGAHVLDIETPYEGFWTRVGL
eukprot:g961.t1